MAEYDSIQDTLTGDKLMVFVEDGGDLVPIAFGTSCAIEMSADTIDTSNKMSGDNKEYKTGQVGWTLSSESMLSFTTGHTSFKKLHQLMTARVPIRIAMSNVNKTPTGELAQGKGFVRGKAIITALSASAQNGSIITSSCTMQGTGPLEYEDD